MNLDAYSPVFQEVAKNAVSPRSQVTETVEKPVLFLTCMDPRVVPHDLFELQAGQAFELENPGNMVGGSVIAGLEFAVQRKNVTDVVVLGHSDCGAIKALTMGKRAPLESPETQKPLPFIKAWVRNNAGLIRTELAKIASNSQNADNQFLTELSRQNVIRQVNKTKNILKNKIQNPSVRVHGWFYNIGEKTITALDDAQDAFIAISERYSD